jgi:quinol monooxygenase YgiN
MIALVAVLKIKPGTEKEVAAACRTMAAAVNREERDCLLYEPYVPVDGNPEVHFIEQYSNMEALEEHRKTAHYQEFREKIKDYIVEPPAVSLLKSLE